MFGLSAVAGAVVFDIVAYSGNEVVGAVATDRPLKVQGCCQIVLLDIPLHGHGYSSALRIADGKHTPIALDGQQTLVFALRFAIDLQSTLHSVDYLLGCETLRQVGVLRLRVKKFIDWEQNNHQQFRQKMNIEPSEITITPLDEQFIKKAIDLVEENISDSDFSVEALASELAMARSTLYKKFMAITGLGPAEFIRTIRIKRGRALLETSQMQITEIAYAVGFTTVKSFTMNFKAEYGITPSEFRQQGKQ